MVYKRISTLKKALYRAAEQGTHNMAEQVKDKIDAAILDYYDDYSPKVYRRTGLLKRTPTVSESKMEGESAISSVYMDTSLQYRTGTWSMANVIDAANNLTHGGFVPEDKDVHGVAIWDRPMEETANNSRVMWATALQSAGLDVR